MTPDEIVRRGYTADGWSVKDMMSHVAAWSEYTASVLRDMATGTWDRDKSFDDPERVDRVNAEWFERDRRLDLDTVRSAWHAARGRLLGSFGALGEITADAYEWFEETGPSHYAEHLSDLVAWMSRLRSAP